MCDEEECAYAQFTNAFRTEIDLKAHKATEHGKGMRKSQQKQVRAVDIDINLVPRAGATRRYGKKCLSQYSTAQIIRAQKKCVNYLTSKSMGKPKIAQITIVRIKQNVRIVQGHIIRGLL